MPLADQHAPLLDSNAVLCNSEARQSLGVIYSRERRSIRSPLSCKGQGPITVKCFIGYKNLISNIDPIQKPSI